MAKAKKEKKETVITVMDEKVEEAKGKLLSDNEIVVVKEESKEVDFNDVDFKFENPTFNDEHKMVIASNADKTLASIEKIVNKYKDLVLTPSNVDYVKTIKSHFVSLRTGIERERTSYKKTFITPASKTADAICAELQTKVDEGETLLGDQLKKYDQKRKDELTAVFEEYKADYVAQFELREEYATQIQFRDKYYNITADEDESAEDIKAQVEVLARTQKDYDTGVQLIEEECKDTLLLKDTYIRQLDYKSPMELILLIKADKQEAEKLAKEIAEKEANNEKVVIGEPHVELKSARAPQATPTSFDDEPVLKERTLYIKYRPELGAKIKQFLVDNEIEYQFL